MTITRVLPIGILRLTLLLKISQIILEDIFLINKDDKAFFTDAE